jgi:hypothetical protein
MSKAIRANQEFFDLLAGDIFARLYTFFPEPIDIHTDGIFYNDELKKQEGFDDDPERLRSLYGHAVQWLADEGYLKFSEAADQDDGSVAFFNVVLTSKGLAALRKTPESLSGHGQTLGDKIEDAAKDIASDAAGQDERTRRNCARMDGSGCDRTLGRV